MPALDPSGYGYLPITEIEAGLTAGFDCGKPNLNDFLHQQALLLHQARLSFTSVLFHRDYEGIVGFFTLANDAIPLSDSEKFDLGLNIEVVLQSFPAVKICRLGIALPLQRDGVGSALMNLLLGDILAGDTFSASRLVVVDADPDEKVIKYYEKNGFEKSLWAEKSTKNHGGIRRGASVKMLRDVMRNDILA